MTSNSDFSNGFWFKKIRRWFSLFANITVILGIPSALYQINQSNKFEERRTAIEAVRQTEARDFITAYIRLRTVSKTAEVKDNNLLLDDLNYVMSVYNKISVLYTHGLAEKDIIEDVIYSDINDFSSVLNNIRLNGKPYPENERKKFDAFLKLMEESIRSKKAAQNHKKGG